jgi:heme oxygenase (mycobilin-producing)
VICCPYTRAPPPPIGPVAVNGVTGGWHDRVMSVVKINAITVPADSGDELARRFAARAGAVDSQDGFEGFELLKPTDGRTTWLVVTRWRDEQAFQAWVNSPAFGHGHRSAAERAGGQAPGPVGVSSELWSYEVAGGSSG